MKQLLTTRSRWSSKPWLKTLLFTAGLFAISVLGFSPLFILGYLLLVCLLYFSYSKSDRADLQFAYWTLAVFAPAVGFLLLTSSPLPAHLAWWSWTAAGLAAATAFYILTKLIYYTLDNRLFAYNLLTVLLLLFVFGVFFSVAGHEFFGLWGVALVLILTLLFAEGFKMEGVSGKKTTVVGLVLALVAFELAWGSSILPFGVVNATAFLVLFSVLVRDSMSAYFRGDLDLGFFFRQLTFFVLLAVVILATTQWTL